MILENGITSDPERVGFYSGMIESIFAFTSFLSSALVRYLHAARVLMYSLVTPVMPCTYLSDHIGRRPVVLVGILGVSVYSG